MIISTKSSKERKGKSRLQNLNNAENIYVVKSFIYFLKLKANVVNNL